MAKSTGMGMSLYADEFNLSNDIQSFDCGGGPSALDLTGIDKSAHERKGGLLDGRINLTAFFNTATGKAHPVLSSLPTSDTIISVIKGTTIGSAAESMVAKQVNYDPSRAADGSLTFGMAAQSNSSGLTWGHVGASIATTTTNNYASVDGGAASSNGLRAYIHVAGFTGTDGTVVVQESSDDGSGDAWATIASFTSVTGVGAEMIEISGAVERYLRVAITVDNFSLMLGLVNVCRL